MFGLSVFALCLLSIILRPSQSLSFYLSPTQEVCFEENLEEHSILEIRYNSPNMAIEQHARQAAKIIGEEPRGKGIDVSVRNDRHDVVYQEVVRVRGGILKVQPAADAFGPHRICLTNVFPKKPDAEDELIEVELEMVVEDSRYISQAQTKTRIGEIRQKVRHIKDLAGAVSNDQRYQEHRETRFRDTVDSTSHRVWMMGLIQTIVLVGLSLWQVWSLRAFFRKKKIL